jgi:tRNA dimethylallyltransferase
MGEHGPGPRPRIVVITGPTATGKSRTAIALAHALIASGRRAEIVSMDAIQVYRGMDIGTDKLSEQEREGVPHHLIDVADPAETFSAAEFVRQADAAIAELDAVGATAVVAGGTGFYLRSLVWGLFTGPSAHEEVRARLRREAESEGLAALYERVKAADPAAAARIHPHDPNRIIRALEVLELTGETMSAHFARQRREGPRYPALIVGLDPPRELMYERINQRVQAMIERGLVAEVEELRRCGYGPELASQKALGYQQIHRYLDGACDLERAAYLIARDTRHYARRQLTWLRKEPGLVWMRADERDAMVKMGLDFSSGGNP